MNTFAGGMLCLSRRRSLLIEFVNSVPRNQLLRHKMTFINDMVHSPIFLRLGQFGRVFFSYILIWLCGRLLCRIKKCCFGGWIYGGK